MNVSNEQSSPRWEYRAPATSKSSAPSGASTGSSKNEKVASPSTKRRISHTHAVRSTYGIRGGWPRASAALLSPFAHPLRNTPRECTAHGAEDFGGLGPQRRAEVVPPALGPELAFRPGELFE